MVNRSGIIKKKHAHTKTHTEQTFKYDPTLPNYYQKQPLNEQKSSIGFVNLCSPALSEFYIEFKESKQEFHSDSREIIRSTWWTTNCQLENFFKQKLITDSAILNKWKFFSGMVNK